MNVWVMIESRTNHIISIFSKEPTIADTIKAYTIYSGYNSTYILISQNCHVRLMEITDNG